jgi:hypothetical protein
MLLLRWCPFKIQKGEQAGLQFTSMDRMSLSRPFLEFSVFEQNLCIKMS